MGNLVKVHLSVVHGLYGTKNVMETEYYVDFLPSVGEEFLLFELEPNLGWFVRVASRYWDKGVPVLILPVHVLLSDLDPIDDLLAIPEDWLRWTEDDKLIDLLLENNWWNYGKKYS